MVAGVDLGVVPEAQRDKVSAALDGAFGPGQVSGVSVVGGGASGALTYRVDAAAGSYLLRVETLQGPLRNPFQYDCMQVAAEAGVAPPIRFVDADAGVVVLPFIEQRPLGEHAGGPVGAATEVGELLAQLHATPAFPQRSDHFENLDGVIAFLERSGRVAAGLLDRHREGFERVRAAYPWEPDTFVSAHNDPNQFNLLYDGERVWLIDWETAARNDPFIDLATASSHLAPTDDLRDVVLRAGLGRDPDQRDRARLAVMGWVVQLWAGCLLLTVVVDPAVPTHTDLTPMSLDEFGARIGSGDLVPGNPVTTHAYAKIVLAAFLEASGTPAFDEALGVVSS